MANVRARLDIEGRLVGRVAVQEGARRVQVEFDGGELGVLVRDAGVEEREDWRVREQPSGSKREFCQHVVYQFRERYRCWSGSKPYIKPRRSSRGSRTGCPKFLLRAMV